MNKSPSLLQNKNFLSTGNLFFDKIVGGLSLGSITLLVEDSPTKLNEVFLKYLISEGLINKEKVFFLFSQNRSCDILSSLPYKSTAVEAILNAKKGADNKGGEIKIAWRYENIKYSNILEELAKSTSYILDLSRQIQEEFSQNLHKLKIEATEDLSMYFQSIIDMLVKRYSNACGGMEEESDRTIVRFVLPNFLENFDLDDSHSIQILKLYFTAIKNVIRSINGILVITISSQLSAKHLNVIKYLSDYVFTVKGFLMDPNRLDDYDGLFTINKVPRLLSLKSIIDLETDTYGLIQEKKKLIIEKIDIGPEIDRNTKVKEKDVKNEITASQAMCGAKHSKDYEF